MALEFKADNLRGNENQSALGEHKEQMAPMQTKFTALEFKADKLRGNEHSKEAVVHVLEQQPLSMAGALINMVTASTDETIGKHKQMKERCSSTLDEWLQWKGVNLAAELAEGEARSCWMTAAAGGATQQTELTAVGFPVDAA